MVFISKAQNVKLPLSVQWLHGGRRGTVPLTLNFCSRWGRVFSL